MNQVEKNKILKQVSSILHFCQEIVSRLSSSSSSPSPEVNNNFNILDNWAATLPTIPVEASVTKHYNDQIGELANTDKAKEAHEELIETIAEFRDKKQELHDIVDCDNDLWWDSSYPPLQFYTLVFDDDEVSLYDADESSFNLMHSVMMENMLEHSDVAEDMSMQPAMLEVVLMQSVLSFLSAEIPNAIYDPNWREERKKKAIHPEFYTLWNHYDSIFTDVKDDLVPEIPEPENIYHTIDLFNVNARFIGNIPKPDSFPVLGVSQDPDFYHKRYERDDTTKHFLKSFPHGALYGYETDIGIVAPPTDPIHGYILRRGSWILHAVKPEEARRHTSRRRG